MITQEEFQKLESWIKNTWKEDEKEIFYSSIMRLSNSNLEFDREKELSDIRELVAKKYEEYAESYVSDYEKYEKVIEKNKQEAEGLERKLSNKDNYLLNNYPSLIKDIDLENRINSVNDRLKQLQEEKVKLDEEKNTKKQQLQEELEEIETNLTEVRKKNISIVSQEDFEKNRDLYNSLISKKLELTDKYNNFDNLEEFKEINERLEELEKNITEENDKIERFNQIKKNNEIFLTDKKYDENAKRLDEDRLTKLNAEIKASENWQENHGNTDYLNIYDKYISSMGYKKKEDEEELIEVKEIKPWEWIKQHKKQILIALGITALTVSVIVLLTQLIPAIVAAQKATQTVGVLQTMVTNSNLWHTAVAAEQASLHAANTTLAGLSGMTNSFNAATGVWTMGGQTLTSALQLASTSAAKAMSAVATLNGTTILTALGGAGVLGVGLLKSADYRKINKEIKTLNNMSDEEFVTNLESVDQLIKNSENLSDKEKQILLKRLKRVVENRRNNVIDQNEVELIEENEIPVSVENEIIDVEPELAETNEVSLLDEGSELEIIDADQIQENGIELNEENVKSL